MWKNFMQYRGKCESEEYNFRGFIWQGRGDENTIRY